MTVFLILVLCFVVALGLAEVSIRRQWSMTRSLLVGIAAGALVALLLALIGV